MGLNYCYALLLEKVKQPLLRTHLLQAGSLEELAAPFGTCAMLDLQARFRPQGLTVTDLNQDGMAEVWLVYRTVCRGDVSPSTQKIIMYEGPRKYAVRGTSRLSLGNG